LSNLDSFVSKSVDKRKGRGRFNLKQQLPRALDALPRRRRGSFGQVEEFFPMASNEKTSAQVAAIAARAQQNPKSLTSEEIQALAASVLSHSSDRQQQAQQGAQNQQRGGQQNPSDPQRR
jgi:hypothetical protein